MERNPNTGAQGLINHTQQDYTHIAHVQPIIYASTMLWMRALGNIGRSDNFYTFYNHRSNLWSNRTILRLTEHQPIYLQLRVFEISYFGRSPFGRLSIDRAFLGRFIRNRVFWSVTKGHTSELLRSTEDHAQSTEQYWNTNLVGNLSIFVHSFYGYLLQNYLYFTPIHIQPRIV